MTTTQTMPGLNKPINLRAIFILNALKILLTFGFFLAFKYGGFALHGLEGDSAVSLMLYATIGYIAAFGAMVFSILKRNMAALRVAITADFAISVFAKAPIGFAIAAISVGLTFTRAVKEYFAYRAN